MPTASTDHLVALLVRIDRLERRVEQLEQQRRPTPDADRHLLQIIADATDALPFTTRELLEHARRASPALAAALQDRSLESEGEIGCWLRHVARGQHDDLTVSRDRRRRRWTVQRTHQHIDIHDLEASTL
ncbi:MAG: hypothetical protein AB7N65_06025 [Vicinamibacterales bacterium]